MSIYIFLSLCILGINFMLYMLFQWTYADKRRAMTRKTDVVRKMPKAQPARPFPIASEKSVTALLGQIHLARAARR